MSKLQWNKDNERFYETGIEDVALYIKGEAEDTTIKSKSNYKEGVAWEGFTSLSESPSGAEATALYANNVKYLNLMSNEEFGGTIEAYTYPDDFNECQGYVKKNGIIFPQQQHKEFALAYKTKVGNDTDGSEHAFKLHLVFNALAQPSEKGYQSINDSPEAMTFSWEFSTTAEKVDGITGLSDIKKPISHLILDSRDFKEAASKAKLDQLLNALYGGEDTEAYMPKLEEILTILTPAA